MRGLIELCFMLLFLIINAGNNCIIIEDAELIEKDFKMCGCTVKDIIMIKHFSPDNKIYCIKYNDNQIIHGMPIISITTYIGIISNKIYYLNHFFECNNEIKYNIFEYLERTKMSKDDVIDYLYGLKTNDEYGWMAMIEYPRFVFDNIILFAIGKDELIYLYKYNIVEEDIVILEYIVNKNDKYNMDMKVKCKYDNKTKLYKVIDDAKTKDTFDEIKKRSIYYIEKDDIRVKRNLKDKKGKLEEFLYL